MSKLRKNSIKAEIELNYLIGKQDVNNGIFEGGVESPKCMNELIVDVHEDEVFDEKIDDFVSSGKVQIVISGSDASIEELGKYLIAFARYNTEDSNYHDHFENIKNSEGKEFVSLMVKKHK